MRVLVHWTMNTEYFCYSRRNVLPLYWSLQKGHFAETDQLKQYLDKATTFPEKCKQFILLPRNIFLIHIAIW